MTEATTTAPPVPDARVLVTGASGFIAGHCILQALDAGWRVRGTLRSLDREPALRRVLEGAGADGSRDGIRDGVRDGVCNGVRDGVRLEFAVADLSSDDGWDAAVAGCSHVLHVASPLPRVQPKDDQELIRPAREGALRVLRAAARAGVARTVMTSSTASIMYGRGGRETPFTEDDWSNPDSADNSGYTRSKTIAERAAWDFVDGDDSGMEFATVNPGLVLGPVLEEDYGTSAEAVLKLLNGDLPGSPRMCFPTVDVRDVATLHLLALTHPGAAGQRFLATCESLWFEDIARILREAFPAYRKRMPERRIPSWLMRILARFDPVMRGVIHDLDHYRECDASRARERLGWAPRSAAEAVRATGESLLAQGLVKPI